jgi:carboxyl-terminal processing protease
MKAARGFLLGVSGLLVAFWAGGGLIGRAAADDDRYRQVILFSEVLSDVVDSYVDPVDSATLVQAAYEGLLGGLDARGAYLTPEEVAAWKAHRDADAADPGFSVLKAGRALHVVAVDPGSPAEATGINVGDQIRSVDGQPMRDQSVDQAWRMIAGKPGTKVRLGLLHPEQGFRRNEVEVERVRPAGRPYEIENVRDTAVLRVRDLARLGADGLARDLAAARADGARWLLVDLRGVAEGGPREALALARVLAPGAAWRLKNRSGKVLEELDAGRGATAWSEPVAVLQNGSTAGGAEALARLLQAQRAALILGESSYGLGTEPELFELRDGAGLLLSAAEWETASGGRWNGKGVEPDVTVRGHGSDHAGVLSDQLKQALDRLAEHFSREAADRQPS